MKPGPVYSATWHPLPAKTPARIRAIHDVLVETGTTFVPVPRHVTRRVAESHELSVPSLKNVALKFCLPVESHVARDISVVHLDDSGNLVHPTYASPDVAGKARSDGITVATKWDLPTNSYVAIGDLNTALVLPTVVGGVPVVTEILRDVVRNFRTRTCFDEDEPLTLRDPPHVGNNVRHLGMTVEEFIRADYAWRMTAQFCPENAGITYTRHPEPIYAHLSRVARESDTQHDPRDPWANERLDADGLPFDPPDPKAYTVLTKINVPRLERATGNKNTRTFDFVRVRLGLKSRETMPDRTAYIRRYFRDIVKIALTRISRTKSFQNKDVPIQFLRLSEHAITIDDELELLFELREI